jgi:rhodanese-related sulfurtransferase
MFGIESGSKHPLDIDYRAARQRLQQGAKMIDVREAHEVAHGMVPGSVHIPLGTLAGDITATLSRHDIDPAAGDVLCICASGGRSRHAAMALRHAGCETAASVMGGVMAWAASGGTLARR